MISCKKNEIKNIDLPLAKGAYEIKQGYLNDLNTKYLNYKLEVDFPASNIIDFHNIFFSNAGFTPYSEDGYGNSIWENYNYKTGDWELTTQIPARYISTWIDSDKKFRIILVLFFKSIDKATESSKKNYLFVEVKATEFFDFREVPIPTE